MTPPLPPGIGPGRPQRRGCLLWALAGVTLLAWAPLLSVTFTYLVANALGCEVNEARVNPCPGPFGWDLGELLVFTGTMGWFMLVTAPFMLATAVGWAALLLTWLWRLARR